MAQLWRMYKMDIMLYLREFLVGETALLEYICDKKDAVTPSAISEDMHLSRARTANILRTLREKGYVEMEVDSADRRRMNVTATPAGENCLKGKHAFLEDYFDKYVDVLGEDNLRAHLSFKGNGRQRKQTACKVRNSGRKLSSLLSPFGGRRKMRRPPLLKANGRHICAAHCIFLPELFM